MRTARPSLMRSLPPRGFTLLEVLITLALIALLAGLFISNAARMLDNRPVAVREVFWAAITEARRFALHQEIEVHLSFDEEKQVFIGVTHLGQEEFPVPSQRKYQIEFLPSEGSGQSVLIGGVLVQNDPLPYITFYPDGTCSAFRAQLRSDLSTEPEIVNIDPWTCAPVLKKEEAF